MDFKKWMEQSLKIWSLLKDIIVGTKKKKTDTPAAQQPTVPPAISDEEMHGWLKALYHAKKPDHATISEDLSTKANATLTWINDHYETKREVPKDLAQYFHNHLVAIKTDGESRTEGLSDEAKMVADSVISLLKSIYTSKEPWLGNQDSFPNATNISLDGVTTQPIVHGDMTWNEIVGEAKSTTIEDFPVQEQADPEPKSTKATKKKSRKAKETPEQKQAKALAKLSDLVYDAHHFVDSARKVAPEDLGSVLDKAAQLKLAFGSTAADAVAAGASWDHAIMAESEKTFDEITELETELVMTGSPSISKLLPPKPKKKKPSKRKRSDYPVKKKPKK